MQIKSIISLIHSWDSITVFTNFFRASDTCLLCIWCLIFHHSCTGKFFPAGSDISSRSTNALVHSLYLFFFFIQFLSVCYLVIIWMDSSKIQEFPLVHGHKCWSAPKKCSHVGRCSGPKKYIDT